MRILVTGTKWTKTEKDALAKALASAKNKYGDELTIVTGYTAPSVAMAFEAESKGITTVIFAPDLNLVPTKVYELSVNITITSLDKLGCQKQMVSTCDSTIALSDNDPVVLEAMAQGKRVWFPISGKVT